MFGGGRGGGGMCGRSISDESMFGRNMFGGGISSMGGGLGPDYIEARIVFGRAGMGGLGGSRPIH